MIAEAAAEALRQVRDGMDFQTPAKVLNRIPAQKACMTLPEFGYSLATYLLHADFWQVIWLKRLRGEHADSFTKDWRVAPESEWDAIRCDFLTHLDEAIAIAEAKPFRHALKSDEIAVRVLLEIAVHDAYHIGQFVLLKRALKKVGSAED